MSASAGPVVSGRVQKRSKPKILGRTFTQLQIGTPGVFFSAHADLLCSRSTFFKQRLQPRRKPIKGDCAVCLVNMNPHKDEITYCTSCGQNFHRPCMTQWLRDNSTCTTCRAAWVTKPVYTKLTCADLDAKVFTLYIQWIYNDQLSICKDEDVSLWTQQLLKAHIAGDTLGDGEFQKAILTEIVAIVKTTETVVPQRDIKFVYDRTTGPCNLRKFLVDMYVSQARRISEDDLPMEFLLELSQAFVDTRPLVREAVDVALEDYIKDDDD